MIMWLSAIYVKFINTLLYLQQNYFKIIYSGAMNDKLFNEKVITPIFTLQHVSFEAECWRRTNDM